MSFTWYSPGFLKNTKGAVSSPYVHLIALVEQSLAHKTPRFVSDTWANKASPNTTGHYSAFVRSYSCINTAGDDSSCFQQKAIWESQHSKVNSCNLRHNLRHTFCIYDLSCICCFSGLCWTEGDEAPFLSISRVLALLMKAMLSRVWVFSQLQVASANPQGTPCSCLESGWTKWRLKNTMGMWRCQKWGAEHPNKEMLLLCHGNLHRFPGFWENWLHISMTIPTSNKKWKLLVFRHKQSCFVWGGSNPTDRNHQRTPQHFSSKRFTQKMQLQMHNAFVNRNAAKQTNMFTKKPTKLLVLLHKAVLDAKHLNFFWSHFAEITRPTSSHIRFPRYADLLICGKLVDPQLFGQLKHQPSMGYPPKQWLQSAKLNLKFDPGNRFIWETLIEAASCYLPSFE